MPGVRAIVTGADAPFRHGIGIADHPLFAMDRIRYDGEPIAAIAADTLGAGASGGGRNRRSSWSPCPRSYQWRTRLATNAPLVHPEWNDYEVLFDGAARGGNVAWEATVVRGDVDAAFARDDVEIVESSFRVGRQNHLSLEPRAVIASYEDGRFHIETSTQVPWSVTNATARVSECAAVGRARHGASGRRRVRAQVRLGVRALRSAPARATGRPVRLVNSRREEMLTCLCRENADILIRSAVTKDGEIVGREAVVLMDCGAYGGEQIFLTTMTAHTLGGNYRLGAVRLASRAVYTNTAPNGAFRACNGVYNTFALERHTDEICAAIGMDPLEFRRRNVLGDDDLGSTGQVFEGDVLEPMLDRMTRIAQREPFEKTPRRRPSLRPRHDRRHLVRLRWTIGGDRSTSMPMAARRW